MGRVAAAGSRAFWGGWFFAPSNGGKAVLGFRFAVLGSPPRGRVRGSVAALAGRSVVAGEGTAF